MTWKNFDFIPVAFADCKAAGHDITGEGCRQCPDRSFRVITIRATHESHATYRLEHTRGQKAADWIRYGGKY